MSTRATASAIAAIAALITATSSVRADGARAGVSWAGGHVGIAVGYGTSRTSVGDAATPLGTAGAPPYGAFACGPALTGNYCDTPLKLDSNGAVVGGQFGIDWQRGALVYGLEANAAWLGIDRQTTLIRPFNDRDVATLDYDWMATLTGRLGVAHDRALFYVRGGAALAGAKFRAGDLDFNGTSFYEYTPSFVAPSRTMAGWTVGLGLEYALDQRLSLRAEYMHTGFRNFKATSPDGDVYKFSNKLDTVTIGINYRLP